MTTFQEIFNKLSTIGEQHGAKLSLGQSKWEKVDTEVLISMADAGVSIIEGTWGPQLALKGEHPETGDEITLYIGLATDEDATAQNYHIYLMKYSGTKERSNCFKAFVA